MDENREIKTGATVEEKIESSINHECIETNVDTQEVNNIEHHFEHEETIKTIVQDGEPLELPTKIDSNLLKLKKRSKYITTQLDSEDSQAIETANAIQDTATTIQKTSATIRTAIKHTSKGVGVIQTAVKDGIKVGSVADLKQDVGRLATSTTQGIKSVISDGGNQLLKTKIDKSTTTDTGTESIKQGLTETRHVVNVGKAVINTKRRAVNSVNAVKSMPQDTKRQLQQIRANIVKAKKRTQKAVELAKKSAEVGQKVVVSVVKSKVGLVLILAVAIMFLLSIVTSSFTMLITSTTTSLMGWLYQGDDTSNEGLQKTINGYISQIDSYVSQKQYEINSIVNMPTERRTYAPYDVITGLNRFGNRDITIEDYYAVISIMAVQKYHKMLENSTEDFTFTDKDVKNAVELFYRFTYNYEYNYCPNRDCKRDYNCLLSLASGSFTAYGDGSSLKLSGSTYEKASSMDTTLEIYLTDGGKLGGQCGAYVGGGSWSVTYNINSESYSKIDWENVYLTVTTTYCNNSQHTYLYGSVVNYTASAVLAMNGFSADEKSLYELYYSEIVSIMEDENETTT